MPAPTTIPTSQLPFLLSCLLSLILLVLIAIYILRRPGLSLPTLTQHGRWKRPTPPTLHLSKDLESTRQPNPYHNPFDSSPSPSPTSSTTDSSQSSIATTPIRWRELWRWRFGTGDSHRTGDGSRGGVEGGSSDGGHGAETQYESPAQSPLGLGRYFFEGGVGIRGM